MFALMRKFLVILLRSVINDADSSFRKEFKELLTDDVVKQNKDAFSGKEMELADLNVTSDQSERLYFAIKS